MMLQWSEPVLWLILFIIFLAAEAAIAGLVSIWFAAGALAAMLLAVVGLPVAVQITAFILVSAACLILIRAWAKNKLNPKAIRTNVNALTGKHALVSERVSNLNQTGRATVDGMDWSIRTEDETETIEPGETVEVIRVSGVKLIVKKI